MTEKNTEIQEEYIEIGIRGMWIPGEVAFNQELNNTDKHLFWIIDSFNCASNKCFASNKYLSAYIEVSETSISNSISKLVKMKYIKRKKTQSGKILEINPEYITIYRNILVKYNNPILKKTLGGTLRKLNTYNNSNINIDISSFNKLKEENKKLFSPELVSSSKSLLAYWNTLSDLSKIRDGKKSHEKSLSEIQRVLSDGFTEEQVQNSMFNFNELVKKEKTYKVALFQFFKFDNLTKHKAKRLKIKNWFETCLDEKNLLKFKRQETEQDENYKLTNEFMKQYAKRILKQNIKITNFKDYEINCFVKASKLLKEFIKKNKDIMFDQDERDNCNKIVIYVFRCIEEKSKISDITPGYFCQEFIYDQNLRKYFVNQNMVGEVEVREDEAGNEFSIY